MEITKIVFKARAPKSDYKHLIPENGPKRYRGNMDHRTELWEAITDDFTKEIEKWEPEHNPEPTRYIRNSVIDRGKWFLLTRTYNIADNCGNNIDVIQSYIFNPIFSILYIIDS